MTTDYATQRAHMVTVARRHFPEADRIMAYAAPETPYLIVVRGKRGYYVAWWDIEP